MLRRCAIVTAIALLVSATHAHDTVPFSAPAPPVAVATTDRSYSFQTDAAVPQQPQAPIAQPPASLDFQYLSAHDAQRSATLATASPPHSVVPNPTIQGPVTVRTHEPTGDANLRSAATATEATATPLPPLPANEPEVAGEFVRRPSTRMRMRATF